MNDTPSHEEACAIERTIKLVEAALVACDEHGFMYAAIDISSALDKLKLIKAKAAPQ
jgi:ribosome-associated translation inhibitor RaiA